MMRNGRKNSLDGDVDALAKFLITIRQWQWCGKFIFDLLIFDCHASLAIFAGIIAAHYRNKFNSSSTHFVQPPGGMLANLLATHAFIFAHDLIFLVIPMDSHCPTLPNKMVA